MSAPKRRRTAPEIRARKGAEPIVCLTAYSAPMAELIDPHVDILLVGDSIAMALYGEDTTLGAGMERMIAHGRAVARASRQALVAVDLPFGAYEESPAQAFAASARVLAETGAQAVKLEGGVRMAETIAFLSARGVPVMGHVGLTPQSVHGLGGFRARGREDAERETILEDLQAVDEAGAFAIVLEGVAEDLADEAVRRARAPVIGIGASTACDGQILVAEDMLGLFDWTPRFVKRYADLRGVIDAAVQAYADDVRARRFPDTEHLYRKG